MAALFESATSGGLFVDAAASGAYGSDLDFDYLLSQVGVFGSPSSDDSLYASTLLDDKSSATCGELSWHVEWFDSSNDIVDLASYDLDPHDLKPSLPPATNGGSTDQNIKQAEATVPDSLETSQPKRRVQKSRASSDTQKPGNPEPSFISRPPTPSAAQDFLLFDLSPEDLEFYSEAFLSSKVEEAPATISPSLFLTPLSPPPSSPLTLPQLTITSPAQNKDTAAMDYTFLSTTSELYVPDNFNYPLTPGYVDNSYVIDMAKSQSVPAPGPKKRRRPPQALDLTPPVSNKRKRTEDDDMPTRNTNVAPEQHKRPRLQAHYHSVADIHAYQPAPMNSNFHQMEVPIMEQTYQYQSDFSPYDTLMSCYTENQIQYEQYAPATPYQMTPFQDGFHTPPVSPFESMGWYAPQQAYIPQKTQHAVWNTPRTVPHVSQYPISPAQTPQKKQKDLRRLSLAPGPRPVYPLSPPHSAPPYPITQQHLLPKLDVNEAGLPSTPPKKDGKKGRKRNSGGGMFINFTADDRETILSGVAPSGSSKAKKDKKEV